MTIVQIPSPNYHPGRQGYRVEAIVVHIMEGTLEGTDSWFRSPSSQVSAHYGIGQRGDVHQYVQQEDTAWHAGRVNNPSWSLIKRSGENLYVNPNLYTVGIEHEGSTDSDWSDAMYATSAALIREIAQKWQIPLDRGHVIGHHEIYSLKTCPGTKVNVNKLIALAEAPAAPLLQSDAVSLVSQAGQVVTLAPLYLRTDPSTSARPLSTVGAGIKLSYDGYTTGGENLDGVSKWYYAKEGYWFWGGKTRE